MISAPQVLQDGAYAYCFQQVDPNALAADVAAFFGGQKYKLEGGHAMQSTWGIGSDTARVLLGGFVKRYQFMVAIEPQPGTPYVWLKLSKGISGAMGGVIGYAKMNMEHTRITTAMAQFFST